MSDKPPVRFKRFHSESKPLHVVNQLLKAIKSGALVPGQRLPSEAELARMTGVSRSSVREALAALRLFGIVETRPGDGTYVKDARKDIERIRKELFGVLTRARDVLQLQEARAAFECGIMRLAAENLDEEDIKFLEEVIAGMRDAAEQANYERFLMLHKRFHLGIAKATKNVVVEQMAAKFFSLMEKDLWRKLEEYLLPHGTAHLRESVAIHERILRALKDRDYILAGRRMEEHFERYK